MLGLVQVPEISQPTAIAMTFSTFYGVKEGEPSVTLLELAFVNTPPVSTPFTRLRIEGLRQV